MFSGVDIMSLIADYGTWMGYKIIGIVLLVLLLIVVVGFSRWMKPLSGRPESRVLILLHSCYYWRTVNGVAG